MQHLTDYPIIPDTNPEKIPGTRTFVGSMGTGIVTASITRTHIPKTEKERMDILRILRQHEPEIKKRFGVATIGIFGSFIRGEERPDSDVDVLVTFRRGEETVDNYMDCKFYLEELFGRKVDLVMKGAIKKRLKPYILKEVVYA